MAAITICSDFGALKNSLTLFPLFPHLFAMKWWDQMPWSSFSECWTLSQLFHSPLSLSSRGFFRSLLFLSFIVPIFAWNVPLVSLVFLKISLVFPILLFSSMSLHWLLRKAFLSLLDSLWNSAFKWVLFPFSPFSFSSRGFLVLPCFLP